MQNLPHGFGMQIIVSNHLPRESYAVPCVLRGHPLTYFLARGLRRLGIQFDPDIHYTAWKDRPAGVILDRVRGVIYCAPEDFERIKKSAANG